MDVRGRKRKMLFQIFAIDLTSVRGAVTMLCGGKNGNCQKENTYRRKHFSIHNKIVAQARMLRLESDTRAIHSTSVNELIVCRFRKMQFDYIEMSLDFKICFHTPQHESGEES